MSTDRRRRRRRAVVRNPRGRGAASQPGAAITTVDTGACDFSVRAANLIDASASTPIRRVTTTNRPAEPAPVEKFSITDYYPADLRTATTPESDESVSVVVVVAVVAGGVSSRQEMQLTARTRTLVATDHKHHRVSSRRLLHSRLPLRDCSAHENSIRRRWSIAHPR